MQTTKVLVAGAGGFIGHHLITFLKKQGYWVRGVDIKYPEFTPVDADEFELLDLRRWDNCLQATRGMEEVYSLAADMGGMGFISAHHGRILHNNILINVHMLEAVRINRVKRYFYTSSACIYPEYRQMSADVTPLKEEEAYPAQPQDAYGWEKLITERLCQHYREDYEIETRIARFHNIFGPYGTWEGGREKVPAALCRKIALAKLTGDPEIEVWGDGEQTRSFCFIDDCIQGIYKLMGSDYHWPLNLGQDRMVTINELADIIAEIARIRIIKKHVPGPQGVRGRNSDNTRLREVLHWEPQISLEEGLARTYTWIEAQVRAKLVTHERPALHSATFTQIVNLGSKNSPETLPRITVITPSYNQCNFIDQTINSVLSQDYPDLEYIVVDGGSTDGTLEILKKYDQRLLWLSERDRGQSHAINKGLKMATGKIITFLNSDDLYEPGALLKVGKFFAAHPEACWLTGRCRTIDSKGKEIRKAITLYKNIWLRTKSYRALLILNYISQPATFWNRDVIAKVGDFDESLRYAMDYDYSLRVGRSFKLWVLDDYLASFRVHSSSKAGSSAHAQFDSDFQIAKRYVTSPLLVGLHAAHNALTVNVYRMLMFSNQLALHLKVSGMG